MLYKCAKSNTTHFTHAIMQKVVLRHVDQLRNVTSGTTLSLTIAISKKIIRIMEF